MDNIAKMVVLDLDGTLLRDDKTISEYTISTLKKCKEKGLKIIYATARGSSAEKLIPADIFDGFVRMGGAVAFAGNTLLYSKCVSTSKARDFLNILDKSNIRVAAELSHKHYSNFKVDEVWDWLTYYEICDFNTLDIEAEKMYALPKTKDEMELIVNNIPTGMRIVPARDDNFTMIMHEEAVKSKAVFAISEYWKIAKVEIIAFGDDLIDLEILEHCGYGIAMGNALEEVQRVAKHICDTNENDGVAKWLEENIVNTDDYDIA
jgi:Cof subfamily protein (haloacid dehalogenase superfamily)